MNIKFNKDGKRLIVELEGRLDTTTAPRFDEELKARLDGVQSLVLDIKNLKYMSSAGLRILLSTFKIMNKKDGMVIRNVNETILEVFEVTGLMNVLTIEPKQEMKRSLSNNT